LNLGFGYNWSPLSSKNHNLKLIDISAVKINPTSEFQNEINSLRDPRLKYSYQNHLVINSSYQYIYSKREKDDKPFFYFSFNFENGGLMLDAIHNVLNGESDKNNQGLVLGVPYAQYIKIENDLRYYFKTGKKVMNVLRFYSGIGLPYNNSKALPFEKSFYIGGANSLRAYPLGMIGLGSYYNDSQLFEKTGDIKLEANYEVRFPIAGSLNGAIFGDAGNIWLLKKSDDFVGGEFTFDRFLTEFYLNIGYGLRYDLQYLIIRIDIAHPIYQPFYDKSERWTMRNTEGKITTGLNFAIGYPF
jgi:outer membrane protein assembly factor BamA